MYTAEANADEMAADSNQAQSTYGAKYCCVINCSNNSKTSIDVRTGKTVRLFRFPDPKKERERCHKWIINIRRADVDITNIKAKVVCSVHFETTAFNCPSDIQSSRLLPTAVPTLVACPNPPPSLQPRRPPPKQRVITSKKRRLDSDSSPLDSTLPGYTSVASSCSTSSDVTEVSTSGKDNLRKELEETKAEVLKLKQMNKSLRRSVQTAKDAKAKLKDRYTKQIHTLQLQKKEMLSKFMESLPTVPAALFKVLLQKKKKVKWEAHKEAMELSLAVFFRSSSAYDVLRSSGFQLPHPSTLRRQFSTVLSGVGFCPQLLEMLRLRTLALAGHERRVTLSLDGMTVTKSLTYKHNNDQLVGMVDCGMYHRSQAIADQGVVVMVRGLTLKWKQVFGYFVTRHNMGTSVLQSVIADAVKLLKGVGLYVDAIVMDQESSQWKWMKDMSVSVDRPFVYHHGAQSFVVPDPPHLIKSLRNNLMTKDISFVLEGKEMTAKWQHIEQVHAIDSQHKLHLAPKLKDCHLVLPRGKKMKVILACQIFSHSVAVAIKLLVERSLMPAEALDTAAFVEKVNTMWDFIDSHSLTAPPGKKAVTRKDFDADQARFRDFSEFTKTWKFSKRRSIPSHQGWLLALSGLEQLSHKMLVEEKILTHLCLRKCNQDHVENLHSQIRHYNGFNDHPSVPAYVNALRCLACSSSVSELLDKTISSGSNCLPDGEHGERAPDPPAPSVASNESQTECQFASFFPSDDAQHSTSSSLPELQSVEKDVVEYIAGYVVKSCMKKIGCSQCAGKITASASAPSSATPPTLTTLKEFQPGALTHVSQELRKVMELFESHYRIMTTGGLPLSRPKATILSKFKMVQFDSSFPACECRDTILAAYCKLRIFWDVRLFNQTLKAQKRGSELNKDKKLNI